MLITVDTGTTNTRMKLIGKNNIIFESKANIGVRDTAISGSNKGLKEGLKNCIYNLIKNAGVKENDIEFILASGMIGSDVGIYELPHITAPAGINDLSRSMKSVIIDDISSIPFLIIPGVKNKCECLTMDNINSIDIMRGEETETFGIMDILGIDGPLIIILPGSHTKIVEIDNKNRIAACHTTLCGEIISAISKNTILNSSLPENLIEKIDKEFLILGCNYSRLYGFNKACFRVRLMEQFKIADSSKIANFFVGSVLADDLKVIKDVVNKYISPKIIIGGSNPLRQSFSTLLRNESLNDCDIIELSNEDVNLCTTKGALKIFKEAHV